MLIWGTGWFKPWANPIFTWNYPVPELHKMINKVPPVAAKPRRGSGGVRLHLSVVHRDRHADRRDHRRLPHGLFARARLSVEYGRTIKLCALSLITISAMLAIGTLTR